MADKTLHELGKAGTELCSAAGRTSFGMGMRMSPIKQAPKKVAEGLLEVADQFEAIADAVRKLASDVCDFDANNASRIIVPSNGKVLS